MDDLWSALCLLAVLEGLWLFAAPGPWKRAMAEMIAMPDRQLRIIGVLALAAGLVMLFLVRAQP